MLIACYMDEQYWYEEQQWGIEKCNDFHMSYKLVWSSALPGALSSGGDLLLSKTGAKKWEFIVHYRCRRGIRTWEPSTESQFVTATLSVLVKLLCNINAGTYLCHKDKTVNCYICSGKTSVRNPFCLSPGLSFKRIQKQCLCFAVYYGHQPLDCCPCLFAKLCPSLTLTIIHSMQQQH